MPLKKKNKAWGTYPAISGGEGSIIAKQNDTDSEIEDNAFNSVAGDESTEESEDKDNTFSVVAGTNLKFIMMQGRMYCENLLQY